MTTIISVSYDALVTLIGTTLTGWTRLFNADELIENFDSALRAGWCLQVESGQTANRNLCRVSDWDRTFTLFLVTEFFGSNYGYTEQDNSIKKLLEAISSVKVAILNDQYLGISTGNAICDVVNDSGVFPLETDTRKFIACGVNISVKTFLGY
jgi:hypothetical protein